MKALARFDPFSFRGVLIITGLYSVIHILIRLSAGFNLAMDDAKENIFTQSFEWGYLPNNPPLYEWTLGAVQLVTGPTLISFLIVKYALLMATVAFLFLAGRRIFEDDKKAAITVFSASLLYQLGYNYHQAFTHSLMVIAATAFALWAFVQLCQERRLKDYLLFGLALGLGLLSKYNFAGFMIVLLGSAMLVPATRKVLLDLRFLLTLELAVLIPGVHFIWLWQHKDLFAQYTGMALDAESTGYFSRVLEGTGNALVAVISFYLPIVFVVLFCCRSAFGQLVKHWRSENPYLLVAAFSFFIAAALIFAGVIFTGFSGVSERYVIPFLLPSFFALMAAVFAGLDDRRTRVWLGATAGLVGVIAIVRFMNIFFASEPFCDDCQRWRPFAGLGEQIAAAEFDPQGIYIAYEENTAGNLRRLLPEADVRSINLLFYQPVKEDALRPCYFVWSEELLGQPVEQKFKPTTELDGTLHAKVSWQHPLKEAGWRKTEWGVTPIPSAHEFYSRFCVADAAG